MAEPTFDQPVSPAQDQQFSLDQGQAPPEPEMGGGEMRADIEKQLAGLNVAKNSLNSKRLAGNNDLEALRKEVLQSLFAAMGNIGVDVTDINSVKDFLTRLEAFDPDLFLLFEMAFSDLSGEGSAQPQEGAPAATNLPKMPGMPGMGASAPAPGAQFGNIMGAMGPQQPPQQ